MKNNALVHRNIQDTISTWLQHFPVVGILGPRQVGKTTLVKQLQPSLSKGFIYLDLELSTDADKLAKPEFFLKQFEHQTIIIDEVQRNKSLFPLLRALIDQKREPGRFILLGSASPELIRDSSESLAGRIVYAELHPLGLSELKEESAQEELWFKGGFPTGLLTREEGIRQVWLNNFIKTYIERDIPLLGLNANPLQTERLWRILASMQGQVLNYSVVGNSLGVQSNSVKKQIDFFEEAYLIRRLYPYTVNIKKRIVKTPKVYIRDTGILHFLVNIKSKKSLLGHYMAGSSWEGFVIQQIIQVAGDKYQYYFYRTHNGAEMDLLLVNGLVIEYALEIKLSNNPVLSKGNYSAIEELKPKKVYIITYNSDSYFINENIKVCSVKYFIEKELMVE